MSTDNGARPPLRRARGLALSRRSRLLIGGSAAIVIGAVLVAPVVLLTGRGTPRAKPCAQSLRYQGREYRARPVTSARVVEGVAVGIGVTSGCGAPAANVNVRSLVSVKPTVALGLVADQSAIYVRRGVCSQSSRGELLACLRGSG